MEPTISTEPSRGNATDSAHGHARIVYERVVNRRIESTVVDVGPEAIVMYFPAMRRLVVKGPKASFEYLDVTEVHAYAEDQH